jgi:hypothetical protein
MKSAIPIHQREKQKWEQPMLPKPSTIPRSPKNVGRASNAAAESPSGGPADLIVM